MKKINFARFSLMTLFAMILSFCAIAAFAQAVGDSGQEISFGKYTLPLILMVILSLVYKVAGQEGDKPGFIPDRAKPLIAIFVGICLGIVGIYYKGIQPTFQIVVDYVLDGFMMGCSAIGLWEGLSAARGK